MLSTAVVTGAGGGLGRAICERLAADGYAVAVVDLDETAAAETRQVIVDRSGLAEVYLTDLRDAAAIETTMRSIEDDLGPIHVLVNNAAGLLPGRTGGSGPHASCRASGSDHQRRFDHPARRLV